MRSISLLAAATFILVVGSGCGDGGGVEPPPENTPPTADFTVSCSSLDCTFTDASTDTDGTVQSSAWTFSDGAVSDNRNTTHHFNVTAETNASATLTVTDNDGAVSAATTKNFTVRPPTTLTCGNEADCSLTLDMARKVTVTLVSEDCEFRGNTLTITAPVQEVLFTDGCNTPEGTVYQLQGGAVFPAGTELRAQITTSSSNVLKIPPSIRVSGDFATGWTLEYDDGGESEPQPPDFNPEPDFNDLVVSIVATP